MKNQDKSEQRLIDELRQRVAELERASQENEAEAALLLQVAPLGVHACDTNGRITFVNPCQERTTGYTAEELVGTYIWDRIEPGPQKDSLPAYLKQLVSDQPPPTPFVTRNIRKNGEVFDTRIDWNYIRNSQGQVTGFVSVVSDITEQRKSDVALRESERRLSTLMSNLPGMAYRCRYDSQWTMEFISDGCVLLTGYTPLAFTGNHEVAYGDIIHPDDRERVWEEVQQAIAESRHFQLEYRIITASGDEKWVWEQGVAIYSDSDQVEALEGQMTDITQRKRAEKAVRASEAKYRRLHQSMIDAFVSVDMDGFIRESNDVYRQMLGYEAEELSTLRYGDLTPEKWHSYEAEIVEKQILPKGHSDIYEKEYRKKDGTIFPVELRTFLIKDDNDQPCTMWAIVRDITERKRAEEALKKAHDELESRVEERIAELTKANEDLAVFRRFVEASHQFFGMATLDGIITYVNPATSRLIADGRLEDVIGKHLSTIYPEDYMQRREKEILPSILRDGHWQGEVVFSIRSGPIVVLQNSFLVRDEQGNPAYLSTVLTDITEHKQAEEEIRQSEEKYRGLLEACPDAVVTADLKGRILFASRQAWSLVGLSDSEELVGRSVFDYVTESDRQRLAEGIFRLLETEIGRKQEYTVIRQDRTTVPTEISSAMSRDATGQPVAIVAVIRDITERKRAEAALQHSHDELQAIYDGMVDGLLIADAETKQFVRANTSICTMLGYLEEELLSKSIMDIHPAKDLPAILETFQALVEGRLRVGMDIPVMRKDGSEFFVDVAASRLRYQDRLCVIGFFRDITERKRAHELLQREHQTLRHLLQSSDHERQLIAYEIHDGLAQQLTGAIMQFQTYFHQKEINPKLAAKAYDAAMTMLQQGHFESRRLIAGVRPPILDESGVVAAVGHLVNEQSRLKGPKIDYHSSVDFDRLAPTVENSIYRIAQEGLTNACQHSKSERVRVSLVQRDDRIQIAIRDWGIGFDTKAVQGNRFGLVGVRQRARLLGGKCSIRSTAGKGTRIAVELPVVERE